jgi:hypothetical protein
MSQQFGDLSATELFCPKCRISQPVRERLLLILLNGELHEYVCAKCGASLGKRTVTGPSVTRACQPPASRAEKRLLRS